MRLLMENLQPVLAGGKGTTTDLSVHVSRSRDALFVFLGVALLERLPADRQTLAYKMLVGRLVNCGFGLRRLERTFGHDHRTMRGWGQGLLSDDPAVVARAFSGQGAMPKVTAPMSAFARSRYRELRGVVRNYRQKVLQEIQDCFGESLSGEKLRQLFRRVDAEAAQKGGSGLENGPQQPQERVPAALLAECLPVSQEREDASAPPQRLEAQEACLALPVMAAMTAPCRAEAAGPITGGGQSGGTSAVDTFGASGLRDDAKGDGARERGVAPERLAPGSKQNDSDLLVPLARYTATPQLQAEGPAATAPTVAETLPEAPCSRGTGEQVAWDRGCAAVAVLRLEETGSRNHSPTPEPAAGTAPEGVNPSVPVATTSAVPATGSACLAAGEAMPAVGLPPGMVGSGKPVPYRPHLLHHAGQVLFSPWLDVVGFDRPAEWAMQAQWLAQILQGAVNIEQSKTICGESLAWFAGPVRPGLDTQRRELKQQAAVPDTALAVLAANARLLPLGPGPGRVFYYDPHTKQYTGELKVLKGWCGRRHSVGKVLHLDFIHTQNGDPCFVQHFDNFYDLRERFFITLARFDQLFPTPLRQGRTFVLDRAIFGHDPFEHFFARGDQVLTWEKGYAGDGWDLTLPAVTFRLIRERNCAGDPVVHRFECQEEPWPKDPRIRRIVVRAWNPKDECIEVSILCTNPRLPLCDAVTLMFNRWLQENDFRYLDTHFGIMQTTSYDSRSYAAAQDQMHDRPVECRQYRQIKEQRLAREAALAKLLSRREKLADAEAACQRELQRLQRQAAGSAKADRGIRKLREKIARLAAVRLALDAPIAQAKQDIVALQNQLDTTLRDESRLALLIADNYRQLDTRAKELMDALKITARNIFRRVLDGFRPLYNNYRDDHTMLRLLSRCSGVVRREGQTAVVELWLQGSFQPAQLRLFRRFLDTMTTAINGHFRGRYAPLLLRLTDGTPQL